MQGREGLKGNISISEKIHQYKKKKVKEKRNKVRQALNELQLRNTDKYNTGRGKKITTLFIPLHQTDNTEY